MTWSIGVPILAFSCMTLNCIYKRNPLSFDLVPSNRSIDNNLTLAIPISLTLFSNACVLLFIYLTISLNSFIVTIYKSNDFKLSIILVSSPYDVVAFNVVITGALRGIASTFCYTVTLVVNI